MTEPKTPLHEVKIRIPLDPEDGRDLDAEFLAADPVGPGEFRLCNSPFFAFDLSAQDVVAAERVGDLYEFRGLLRRGGHSTYRVYLLNHRAIEDEDVQAAWQPIAALGLGYERAASSFFSIDIPPGKDIAAAYDLLEAGEAAGLWEFEEAHYEPAEDAAAGSAAESGGAE